MAYTIDDYNYGGWTSADQTYAMQPTAESQTGGLAGNFAGLGNGLKNTWNSLFGGTSGSLDVGGMQNAGGKTVGTGGMGLGDYLSLGSNILTGVGKIMDARTAKEGLKLAQDQFRFSKASANRNVANQAKLVNNQIQNAGEVGMSLAGNTMDNAQRAARQGQLDSMKVDGSRIG